MPSKLKYGWLFQSTLPVGGATTDATKFGDEENDFNPRSPWGERHSADHNAVFTFRISIHAPRGGSDKDGFCLYFVLLLFQSTLPVGGATRFTLQNAL